MNKNILANLQKKGKSQTPIEDTIRRRWSDIQAGAANGHSRATIRSDLATDGEDVGSKSGFNASLTRVAKSKGVDLDQVFRSAGRPRSKVGQKARAADATEVPVATGGYRPPSPANGHQEAPPRESAETVGQDHHRHGDDREGVAAPKLSPFADDRFSSEF